MTAHWFLMEMLLNAGIPAIEMYADAIGVTASDSLQTAENIYEALHLLWLYPALAVVLSLISAFLPAGAWKLLVLLEVVFLAGAAIYAIVGATAAARMTELDREGKRPGAGRKGGPDTPQ